MQFPQLLLSDDLLFFWNEIQLFGIKPGNMERAQKLFSFYRIHAINEEQYKRSQVPLEPSLKASLMMSPLKELLLFKGAIEDLSLMTRLKIILCEDRCDFPYVNINGQGEMLESSFAGTFDNVPRDKCLAHLTALCKNAISILICDKYLYVEREGSPEECKQRSFERLDKIMKVICPTASCKVEIIDFYYDNNPHRNEFNNSPFKYVVDQLKLTYESVDRKRYVGSKNDVHDRYMLVKSNQGKVKILFSSGFDNLFDNTKDMTYIVRCL